MNIFELLESPTYKKYLENSIIIEKLKRIKKVNDLIENFHIFIEAFESYIKSVKEDTYTFNSLLYYYRKTIELHKKYVKNQQNVDMLNQVFSSCKMTLYSLINDVSSKKERDEYDSEKKNILAFEACPSDFDNINSVEEIKAIYELGVKCNYNVILRFNTNDAIFKKTCLNYEIFYLHFAGHHVNDKGLAFIGSDGKSSFLSFEMFKNFFENIYRNYSRNPINNCYINACDSDAYINKISNSTISCMFANCIGHKGKNYDCFALESSKEIYNGILNNKLSVKESFEAVQKQFAASLSDDKNNYATGMILV